MVAMRVHTMVPVIIDNLKDGDVPHPTSTTRDPHMHEEKGQVNEAAMEGAGGKNTTTLNAPVSKVLLPAMRTPNLGRGFSAVLNFGDREMPHLIWCAFVVFFQH